MKLASTVDVWVVWSDTVGTRKTGFFSFSQGKGEKLQQDGNINTWNNMWNNISVFEGLFVLRLGTTLILRKVHVCDL